MGGKKAVVQLSMSSNEADLLGLYQPKVDVGVASKFISFLTSYGSGEKKIPSSASSVAEEEVKVLFE
jgi:hypothetical protein